MNSFTPVVTTNRTEDSRAAQVPVMVRGCLGLSLPGFYLILLP